MSGKQPTNIGRIGNRLLALEKQVGEEFSDLKQELVEARTYFQELAMRQEARQEIRLEPQPYDPIPYQPFPDRFLKRVEAWEGDILGRLPNLAYIGENEHGVPLVADFEVKITLPALYLMMAKQAKNRWEWMREHPYQEWREQWAK